MIVEMATQSLHIAIDGPVAAGKGTVSRLVADRLGWLYVDTGAMYRATALLALRSNIPLSEINGRVQDLVALLCSSTIALRNPLEQEKDGRLVTVLLNGEDVSWDIRTPECSQGASIVAQLGEVRQELVAKQQQIAKTQHVVMEGRDITFRVLPDAQLKIYLDASIEERASRRHQELLARGVDTTFEEVLTEIKQRDERDMNRSVDPLHATNDSWILDTTGKTIEEVVGMIESKARALQTQLHTQQSTPQRKEEDGNKA